MLSDDGETNGISVHPFQTESSFTREGRIRKHETRGTKEQSEESQHHDPSIQVIILILHYKRSKLHFCGKVGNKQCFFFQGPLLYNLVLCLFSIPLSKYPDFEHSEYVPTF